MSRERNGDLPPGPARILITDDQSEAVALSMRVLGSRYRCESASNVEEARTKLAEEPFDLALCDIRLPGPSGWTLGKEISEQHADTAVVFVTGENDPHLAQQAFEFGAYGYLVKPFHRGQLLITVMNALKRRELEVAATAQGRTVREQFQAVIDHAPMPIFVKDRDFRFLVANKAASAAAGMTPSELIGKTVDVMMPPAAAERSRAGDRRILDGEGAYNEEEDLTIGGERRIVLATKFPLTDEKNEVYAVCGTATDVTEQHHAAELQDELSKAQHKAIEELQASRQETVERLSRAVEFRDTETGDHVRRMAAVSAFLAEALGLGDDRVALLLAAAPMHDVGKVAISDAILLKPGPLDDEERREMERHTTIGHELLDGSGSELMQLAATVAVTHHERFDGGGYPLGLTGDAIPIEGRVVAVADVFDALLSDRPYRPAMSLDEALGNVAEGVGSHFDPAVANALLERSDDALRIRARA